MKKKEEGSMNIKELNEALKDGQHGTVFLKEPVRNPEGTWAEMITGFCQIFNRADLNIQSRGSAENFIVRIADKDGEQAVMLLGCQIRGFSSVKFPKSIYNWIV